MKPPPKVFSMPVVRCPSCGHGIDPHGYEPGDICGVGDEQAVPCECLWSPNDIAAQRMVDLRAEATALRTAQLPIADDDGEWVDVFTVVSRDDVLALLGGGGDG